MRRSDWTQIAIAVAAAMYLCFIIGSEAWPTATVVLAVVAITAIALLALAVIFGIAAEARDREQKRRDQIAARLKRADASVQGQVRQGLRKGASNDS